jgi:ribulose bisphosphate carboxylase small subunit
MNMQLNDYFTRLTSLALFNKVENLVQQSLLGDWIIRIEYGEQRADGEISWRQWNRAFFAVKDAKSLNHEILNCRMCFPIHPIRLYAEKLNPQTKIIYWVYTPQEYSSQEAPSEQEYTPVTFEELPQGMQA